MIALALAGCGARTALELSRDAAGPLDAAPLDAAPLDAGPPTGRCRLGVTHALTSGEPGFVWSAIDGDRGYTIALSTGWPPDEQLRTATIPFALDALGAGPFGLSRWDRAFLGERDDIVLQADDQVTVLRRDERDGDITVAACRPCYAASEPVRRDLWWAVPLRVPDAAVAFASDPEPPILQGPFGSDDGTSAGVSVVAAGDEVWLLWGGVEGALMHRLSWDAVLLTDAPIVIASEPIVAFAAVADGAGGAVVALRNADGRLDVVGIDARGSAGARTTIADGLRGVLDVDLATDAGAVAVTWTDFGRPAAHVAVLELSLGAVLLAPTTIASDAGSYLVTSEIVRRPGGFAVFWGGWAPASTYGIHATAIDCAL